MPVIERRITIPTPPERVWEVLADVAAQPQWMRDLKSIRFEGRPGDGFEAIGVGTRAVGTVRMFGFEQSDPVEIDAFEPPRHFGLRHLGGFTGRGDFWLEPVGGGDATRVRWREELWSPVARAGRVGRLLDRLFTPVFEVVFRDDLRRLREIAVSGGPAAGTPRRGPPTAAPPGGPG